VPAQSGHAARAIFPKEIIFPMLIFYKKRWPKKRWLDKTKQKK
jgi:hypothetical protein